MFIHSIVTVLVFSFFFFSSRRRHTRSLCDWSSDVCSSDLCIITSLNLYEFSQVNNNEMGILIERAEDAQLYRDAYDEAQRIIRISDEVRISMERVSNPNQTSVEGSTDAADWESATGGKLTSSKIAKKGGWKTALLLDRRTIRGSLALGGDRHVLTAGGTQAGLEFVPKSRFGPYLLWPEDINLS